MSPKYESDFTQRVVEAIENARLDKGISVQELIAKSGIRRSTYFRKMRGENTFTTEDVDTLARALDLDPFLVLRAAVNVSSTAETVDPHEIDLSKGDYDLAATHDRTGIKEQIQPDYENESQDTENGD